jgi:hypothetical protein
MPTSKKTAKKSPPKKIYVGRSDPLPFVRTYEETDTDDDEFVYTIFQLATKPEPSDPRFMRYNAIIGPFRTMAGALVFKSEEGVNSVDHAERIASER